jgi:hypothetical protein
MSCITRLRIANPQLRNVDLNLTEFAPLKLVGANPGVAQARVSEAYPSS